MSTFVPVDDSRLIALINEAQRRIIFIAPGLTLSVAKALGKRLEEVDRLDVTVVLDADEEVCRIGYGEITALEELHRMAGRQGYALRSQPGLRVGVLLSDDKTMIWSPTPRSVEAPPDSSAAGDSSEPTTLAPNGLVLGENPAEQLAMAVSAEGTETRPQDSEIGRAAISIKDVEKVSVALKENPPIPVDLARITRVFSTKVQFVELKVSRAKLSKMKLSVPSDLLNADADDDLKGIIDSQLRAFGEFRDEELAVSAYVNGKLVKSEDGTPEEELVSEAILERKRNDIDRRFIRDIKDFGRLIEKSRKDAFLSEIEAYKCQLSEYSTKIWKLLEDQAERIIDDAVRLIISRHRSGANKNSAALDSVALKDELHRRIEKTKGEPPSVSVIFKDVTYEQTQSSDFRKRLELALPLAERKRLGDWSSHFEAARRLENPPPA